MSSPLLFSCPFLQTGATHRFLTIATMQHSTIYTLLLLVLLILESDCFVLRQTCSSRSVRLAAGTDAAPPAAVPSGIKTLLSQDMKAAMKAKDKERLAGIRWTYTLTYITEHEQ